MRPVPLLPLLACGMPLVAGLAIAQVPQAPEAAVDPLAPPLPPPPSFPAASPLRPGSLPKPPGPLRPGPSSLGPGQTRRFDQSLEELVRQGAVTPAEGMRLRAGAVLNPVDGPVQSQACRSGALSAQECRSGLALRWRGRIPGGEEDPQGLASRGPSGAEGPPLPPLTVPVSALLAGADGQFSLASVFQITPRPAPLLGNGNRRLLFPIMGSAVTTSTFGWRLHPMLGSWLMHAGRDLAAPEGTPVVAALSGRVTSSGLAGGYGLAVELEHQRPLRRTLYGHLSELYVKAGDQVRQGEVIGRVGSTGLSTGPHLHFEVRQPADGGWAAMDPGELDPGRGSEATDPVALLVGQLLQSLERSHSRRAAR